MLVKDQIRVQMEKLGVDVPELARRVGVSNQSIRHWLAGRSFPGKRHTPALEKALSFKLDFSEGNTPSGAATVDASLQKTDIELFLLINRLPPQMKLIIERLVREVLQIAAASDGGDLGARSVRHSTPRPPRQASAR